jgi:hypothetical protein
MARGKIHDIFTVWWSKIEARIYECIYPFSSDNFLNYTLYFITVNLFSFKNTHEITITLSSILFEPINFCSNKKLNSMIISVTIFLPIFLILLYTSTNKYSFVLLLEGYCIYIGWYHAASTSQCLDIVKHVLHERMKCMRKTANQFKEVPYLPCNLMLSLPISQHEKLQM